MKAILVFIPSIAFATMTLFYSFGTSGQVAGLTFIEERVFLGFEIRNGDPYVLFLFPMDFLDLSLAGGAVGVEEGKLAFALDGLVFKEFLGVLFGLDLFVSPPFSPSIGLAVALKF